MPTSLRDILQLFEFVDAQRPVTANIAYYLGDDLAQYPSELEALPKI